MDIEHYYIEKGCGEPLILLHGNGENCDYFRGRIDVFAKRYHIYALDTRGHGKWEIGYHVAKAFTGKGYVILFVFYNSSFVSLI